VKKVIGKKGFTLIELLVAISIFVILGVAVYSSYITFYRSSKRQISITQTGEELRPALEMVDRMVRDAGFGILSEDLSEAFQVIDNTTHGLTRRSDISFIPEITVCSLLGEHPESGKNMVYDEDRDDDTNLGDPRIMMDVNKEKLELVDENPVDGAIQFRCKSEDGTNCEDPYYYVKTLKLSVNPNDPNSEGYNEAYRQCEPNTYNLLIKRGDESIPKPLIPCVAYFAADYGCKNGDIIEFKEDICDSVLDLKVVRIGLIVQSGYINKMRPIYDGDAVSLTFPTIGTYGRDSDPLSYTLIENSDRRKDQRYYNWHVIEKIISMENLTK